MKKTPKLQYHKATGRWFVWDGRQKKNTYLGYDEYEAKITYHDMMKDFLVNGEHIVAPPNTAMLVCELVEKYLNDREVYYKDHPKSFDVGKMAMSYLNKTAGSVLCTEFGMLELRATRDAMLRPTKRKKLISRGVVNRMMREIVKFWKWCASMEYVDAEVYRKCETLESLKEGRCTAPEMLPVMPVPEGHVELVKNLVSESVRILIELQLLTGARPGELVGLKTTDIDRTEEPWKVSLLHHKTAHRGKSRTLYLGPQAQAVIRPLLLKRGIGEYLFDPHDGYDYQKRNAKGSRRSNQIPNHPKTPRKLGDHYTVGSYRTAIRRACVTAEIPIWHPHQLRHTAATELRKQYGVEVARAVLGHSHLSATEIYAEVDATIAAKVAKERG